VFKNTFETALPGSKLMLYGCCVEETPEPLKNGNFTFGFF
jgi:hypothetical protein